MKKFKEKQNLVFILIAKLFYIIDFNFYYDKNNSPIF